MTPAHNITQTLTSNAEGSEGKGKETPAYLRRGPISTPSQTELLCYLSLLLNATAASKTDCFLVTLVTFYCY